MNKAIEIIPEPGIQDYLVAATLEGLYDLGEVPDGAKGVVGGDKIYVRLNGKWEACKGDEPVEPPQWMMDWFNEGKKLGVKVSERSTEELDMLKECIIGASFIHKYCRDKELPTAMIDMIICETAMRWYETDYGVIVGDVLEAKELPAYYMHVTKFIEEFSSHVQQVREAVATKLDPNAEGTLNMNLQKDDEQ